MSNIVDNVSNFFTNMFGTIGTNKQFFPVNADFIPADGNGKTIKIKGDSVKWLGLQNPIMQKYSYEFCYPVATVVDRLAEYDLTGTVEINRTKGKGKESEATSEPANRMRTLLEQPNPLQSWDQFRGQQDVYKRIFGYCPVLPVIPAGYEAQPWFATMMINLPPWLFRAVPKMSATIYTSKIEDIVDHYSVSLLGKQVELKPNQIFILEDGFMQDESTSFLLPLSKLVGLDMAVSNICAAMEADNVLLRKKGPLGFISHDAAASKDSHTGYIPMTKTGKKEVQNALNSYGLTWSQYLYAVTRNPVKWNPTSFNVGELGTKETITACEKAICHRFAFPYILYEEAESTYANGDNASATVYQTNVIPNAKKDMNKYNKFFKLREEACQIELCFDHVAALQEDRQFAATAAYTLNQALQIEWQNNVITKNQWLIARGYEPLPDGDVYFKDTQVTKPKDENPAPENT